MARIGVVTDSTAYLPGEVIERLGIKVVPLIVRFGDQDYAEGKEIDNHTFYQRFRQEKGLPKTSQPSVGDFVKTYQELLMEKDAIVSIHISGGISGTVDAASAAAQIVGSDRIRIIDSQISCLALGFLPWEAAEMAEQGYDLEEIVARVEEIKKTLRAYFMVDNLEYLAKGGRLSGMAAAVGSLLQIKPILHFVDGKIEVLEKRRTKKRAEERLIELFKIDMAAYNQMRVAVIHAESHEEGRRLLHIVKKEAPGADIHLSEFGPVVGTYLGPGALGIAYYELGPSSK